MHEFIDAAVGAIEYPGKNDEEYSTPDLLHVVREEVPIGTGGVAKAVSCYRNTEGVQLKDLAEEGAVEQVQFSSDNHVIQFEQWYESATVEGAADGPENPFAVDYMDRVELYTSAADGTRIWIDVVNDDSEVV